MTPNNHDNDLLPYYVCPDCDSDRLYQYHEEVTIFSEVTSVEPDEDTIVTTGNIELIEGVTDTKFSCAECQKIIAENEDELVAFLKQLKQHKEEKESTES